MRKLKWDGFERLSQITLTPKLQTLLLIVEQFLNTAWNFIIGMIIAKQGGVIVFGVYSSIMAVFFFLAGPVAAMTTTIGSVDVSRLHLGRGIYLAASRITAERIVLTLLPVTTGIIFAMGVSIKTEHVWITTTLGAIYVAMCFFGDLWRRTLALANEAPFLLIASALRLFGLAIVIGLSFALCEPSQAVNATVVGSIIVSGLYLVILRLCGRQMPRTSKWLRRTTFARQTRLGGWGFFSALIMNTMDQGLIIYASLMGKSEIAAQIRSVSYLFGLMNPLLLVFALVMPTFIARHFGSKPTLANIFLIMTFGAVIGVGSSSVIAALSVYLWLPFLGSEYTSFESLTYWVAAAFACMVVRTFVMPLLTTRAPRSIFITAIFGTAIGLAVAFSHHTFDALAICRALLSAAIVLLTSSIITLLLLELRSNRSLSN